jgi:hypothetical protein
MDCGTGPRSSATIPLNQHVGVRFSGWPRMRRIGLASSNLAGNHSAQDCTGSEHLHCNFSNRSNLMHGSTSSSAISQECVRGFLTPFICLFGWLPAAIAETTLDAVHQRLSGSRRHTAILRETSRNSSVRSAVPPPGHEPGPDSIGSGPFLLGDPVRRTNGHAAIPVTERSLPAGALTAGSRWPLHAVLPSRIACSRPA